MAEGVIFLFGHRKYKATKRYTSPKSAIIEEVFIFIVGIWKSMSVFIVTLRL